MNYFSVIMPAITWFKDIFATFLHLSTVHPPADIDSFDSLFDFRKSLTEFLGTLHRHKEETCLTAQTISSIRSASASDL